MLLVLLRIFTKLVEVKLFRDRQPPTHGVNWSALVAREFTQPREKFAGTVSLD